MKEAVSHVANYHLKNKLINVKKKEGIRDYCSLIPFLLLSVISQTLFVKPNVQKILSTTDTQEMELWIMSQAAVHQNNYEIIRFIKNRKGTKGLTISPTENAELIWEVKVWPMTENELKSETCVQLLFKEKINQRMGAKKAARYFTKFICKSKCSNDPFYNW